MIRLAIPTIEEDDLAAVREVLRTGFLVQGKRVAEFEGSVAACAGTSYAVAVSNCTAALHLALLALDVKAGDRVAVTTYSWPATANVIELCGARPVFVDIEPDTYNMDPNALEEALQRNLVKAVIPVHTFGGMADMPRILESANRHGVPVIEDAACALGAELNGRRAGSFGLMGCFSFHPRKAVTTGEGGTITTNDAGLAKRLRILRNHGQDPDAPAPDFVLPGFNYRLTEFQAAMGLTQMNKLERLITARREIAKRYDALLAETPLKAPAALDGSRHVYQSYVCLLPPESAPRRTDLITALKSEGIETTIGTYHMPLLTYYGRRYEYAEGGFPNTDSIAARALSLPVFESLTPAQQEQVVRRVVAGLPAPAPMTL
jgi:dTDP-4-amino-4,6-dideoxygalactose transaminase